MDSSTDPKANLELLSESLSALSDTLDPLRARPFEDLLAALRRRAEDGGDDEEGTGGSANGDRRRRSLLEEARLEVLLAYTIQDLVWIYLRTRGIEPSTHPVVGELDRVKGYFAKLKQAEKGPEMPKTSVDKPAANRFIRHALADAKRASPASSPSSYAIGRHSRFSALAHLDEKATNGVGQGNEEQEDDMEIVE